MNKLIPRQIEPMLHKLLQWYPVVTINGPRQAGKTTLAQTALKGWDYYNLDMPQTRQLTLDDPMKFIRKCGGKTILDEIHNAPILLDCIKVLVDEERFKALTNQDGFTEQNVSRFVLTGSHQPELHKAITQSLAGRTGLLKLYPLSISELAAAGMSHNNYADYIFEGFLPKLHQQQLQPSLVYEDYNDTYVQRDIRELANLKNLVQFQSFMRLLASRVGQVVNYASLANDAKISTETIRHWLSILEGTFVIYRLMHYYQNFGKRAIHAPKFYFVDTGLLCYLLEITDPSQVLGHQHRGQLFENLVVMESVKYRANQKLSPWHYFYRDSNRTEVDLLISNGGLMAAEIKSGNTWHPDMLKGMTALREIARNTASEIKQGFIVYDGERDQINDWVSAINFRDVKEISMPVGASSDASREH